jgi:hypothetical protein
VPKNAVTDPITDQEIAFAHLIMSGTMNDRQAAKAVGLNPDTAAYTKSKPRVRDYMIKHRAAVSERLVDEEAEGLRKLNLGRDQIRARVLDRLWELATLSPEATRNSIAGQMKAMAMIVAIEGLIPDHRSSPSGTQPTASPVKADFYKSAWNREPAAEEPSHLTAAPETQSAPQPAASLVPEPASVPEPALNPATAAPPPPPAQPSLTDPLIPKGFNWVPQSAGTGLDVALDTRQPFSIKRSPFNGRRR